MKYRILMSTNIKSQTETTVWSDDKDKQLALTPPAYPRSTTPHTRPPLYRPQVLAQSSTITTKASGISPRS
jgi:hypothetical protein